MSEPLEIQFQLRAKAQLTTQSAARLSTGRLPRITRVLALAIHFDTMIRQGDAKDYTDIGRLSCLCRERVSQIMRLTYLAPDIQMELLYLPPIPPGRDRVSETAVRKIASVLSWEDQRRAWTEFKQSHKLDS